MLLPINRYLPILALLLLPESLFSQLNLITNPDFEEHTDCPGNPDGDIYMAPGWYQTDASSTDYFHICGFSGNGVPGNLGGYQYPRSGNAYAGFLVTARGYDIPNLREYLGNELLSPLKKDSLYFFQLHTNLGGGIGSAATDRLDIHFSQEAVETGPPPWPGLTQLERHISNPEGRFLNDTLNWTPVCGTYRAKGGEKHILVGNFKDDSETAFDSTFGGGGAYYFFDDFLLIRIPEETGNPLSEETLYLCDTLMGLNLQTQGDHEYYLWSTGDTTDQINIHEPGLYTLEAGINGCSLRDTVEVVWLPPGQFSLGDDSLGICQEEWPFPLEAPTAMDTYLWQDGSDEPAFLVPQPGLYSLSVSYTCGVAADSIFIFQLNEDDFQIDLGPDTILCNQPLFSIPLQAPSHFDSYLWNTGDQSYHTIAHQPDRYWVQAQWRCGLSSDSILIQNQPLLQLELGPDTTICYNAPFLLSPSPDFSHYQWQHGPQTPQVNIEKPGLYVLEAEYPCGIQRDSITIRIHPEPQLEFQLGTDTFNCNNDFELVEIELNPGYGHPNYLWSDGSTQAGILVSKPGLYWVQSQYPCELLIDSIQLKGCPPNYEYQIWAPNAFTPNADGKNDEFFITARNIELVSWQIFNRWGEKIYTSNSLNDSWDGQINGKNVPSGVYLYQVLFRTPVLKEVNVYKGVVMVMR